MGNPFDVKYPSFDEYRNQEIFETNDGAFFDGLDEMFGIVPGTNEFIEDSEDSDDELSRNEAVTSPGQS